MFFSYASDQLPSVKEFVKALGVKGENAGRVEELSTQEFDPRDDYRDVLDRVGQAGKGKAEGSVKVFRLEVDERGTRVEYYVVTVGERSLVGVVAKAVES